MTDKEKLLEAMKGLGDGVYKPILAEEFEDPELGEAYNAMLEKIMLRNNGFLARINDAQTRIGDTSCLKSMFEKIEEQQETIAQLQEARAAVNPSDDSYQVKNNEFLALALMLRNNLEPSGREMNHALDLINRLPIWDQGALETLDIQSLVEPMREIQKLMSFSMQVVEGTNRRILSLEEDARELFANIDNTMKLSNSFLGGVDSLTESYKNLSAECLDTGRHLYRISRDIDNARNDLFRWNSRPTLHDSLRVYEVDHLTLAWRLYNNIVEFESLRLTQLNNPETCKLGVWIRNVADPLLTESEEFHRMVSAHDEFHKSAVICFEAKQEYDIPKAMEAFAEVMKKLGVLREAMDRLHEYLRENGDTDETDIWIFRG